MSESSRRTLKNKQETINLSALQAFNQSSRPSAKTGDARTARWERSVNQGKRTAAVATPPSLTVTERTLRPCCG